MLARTDSRARAFVLLLLLSLIATVIGGRLAFWHVLQHDRLSAMAADQLAQNQEIPAERGVILDARGQLLATSVQVYSVYATPPQVSDPELEANVLAGLLQLPKADLVSKLSSAKAWLWLRRRVDPLISDTIRALALPGIGLLPETLRVYPTAGAAPGSTLAAQLIGYVNVNGTGQYGVEGSQTSCGGHAIMWASRPSSRFQARSSST